MGCHEGHEDALCHLASVVGELHGKLNKCRLIYWRPETEAKFVVDSYMIAGASHSRKQWLFIQA